MKRGRSRSIKRGESTGRSSIKSNTTIRSWKSLSNRGRSRRSICRSIRSSSIWSSTIIGSMRYWRSIRGGSKKSSKRRIESSRSIIQYSVEL